MTAQLGRERLEEIAEDGFVAHGEVKAMARRLLAAMDSEPVGEVVLGDYDDCGDYPDAKVVCIAAQGQADWNNFRNGTKLYAAPPAPVAVPDDESESEMKWRDLALQFDGHRMQSICFLKYILSQLPETEFVEAREFLKSGPLPGEEVLRNRITAMLNAGPVTGWIKCSERMPEQKQSNRYIGLNLLLNERTVVQGGFDDGSFWLDGVRIDNVTRWMPLPAAPEQE